MEKEKLYRELSVFYNRQLAIYKDAVSSKKFDPRYPFMMRQMEAYIQNLYAAIEKEAPGCLISPGTPIVQALRMRYPVDSVVVLDAMDDIQAPLVGTAGTVRKVDDIGTVHISWASGGSLGVAYGKDHCHRLYAVKRSDGLPIPLQDKYPSGSRIRLDKDAAGVFPSGITGTVKCIDPSGRICVALDGYSSASLVLGTDRFHRVWDLETDPKAIAEEIHSFCENNHYRQSIFTIGYWQPGVLLEQTVEKLYSDVEIRRVIQGIYRFRLKEQLSTNERCRADKLLQTLYARCSYISPAILMTKERIASGVYQDGNNEIEVDISDLHMIPITSIRKQSGTEVHFYVNLIDLSITAFENKHLVKSIQYDSLMELFISGLLTMGRDTLTALAEDKEAETG